MSRTFRLCLIALAAIGLSAWPSHGAAQEIRGVVVVQGSDMPVPGATVVLLDADMRNIARARTGDDGVFTFQRLRPGRYLLQAQHGGVQTALSAPTTVGDSALVHAHLEIPSPLVVLALTCGPPLDPEIGATVLVGVAHDRETGVALPNAPLELAWPGSTARAVTDAGGHFRFCDLPPGVPMTLSASIWGRSAVMELMLSAAPVNRADFDVAVGTVSLSTVITGRRQVGGANAGLVVTLRDAATGAPLTAAGAALQGTTVLAPANPRGQVRFTGVAPGDNELRIEQVGYGRRDVALTLVAGEELHLEVQVPPRPIALDPIGVRAHPESERSTPRQSTTRVDVISGAQMAFAEQRGARVVDVIRQRFPSLIVVEGAFATIDSHLPQRIVCVESIRRLARLEAPDGIDGAFCDMVVVVVDGVPTFQGGELLRNLPASDLESVQYLGPLDAGGRYGTRASQTGALLLWTRGRGPYQTPDRNGPPDAFTH